MTLMQSVLRKGDKASASDKYSFEKYVHKDISLEECKQEFIENNRISIEKSVLITNEEFKEWLKSLGWWRNE